MIVCVKNITLHWITIREFIKNSVIAVVNLHRQVLPDVFPCSSVVRAALHECVTGSNPVLYNLFKLYTSKVPKSHPLGTFIYWRIDVNSQIKFSVFVVINFLISSSEGSSIIYFCTKMFGSNPAVAYLTNVSPLSVQSRMPTGGLSSGCITSALK